MLKQLMVRSQEKHPRTPLMLHVIYHDLNKTLINMNIIVGRQYSDWLTDDCRWRTWPGLSPCRGTCSCMTRCCCSVRNERRPPTDTRRPRPTASNTRSRSVSDLVLCMFLVAAVELCFLTVVYHTPLNQLQLQCCSKTKETHCVWWVTMET